MTFDPDELAGVVDLFGALTREELRDALAELAFKRGDETDATASDQALVDALDAYALVEVDAEAVEEAATQGLGPFVLPGPTAFPAMPEGAEDLPHIMSVERRTVDRRVAGEQVRERIERDAIDAIQAGDVDRLSRVLDVTYDLEAWAPVEAARLRDRMADELGE